MEPQALSALPFTIDTDSFSVGLRALSILKDFRFQLRISEKVAFTAEKTVLVGDSDNKLYTWGSIEFELLGRSMSNLYRNG